MERYFNIFMKTEALYYKYICIYKYDCHETKTNYMWLLSLDLEYLLQKLSFPKKPFVFCCARLVRNPAGIM